MLNLNSQPGNMGVRLANLPNHQTLLFLAAWAKASAIVDAHTKVSMLKFTFYTMQKWYDCRHSHACKCVEKTQYTQTLEEDAQPPVCSPNYLSLYLIEDGDDRGEK